MLPTIVFSLGLISSIQFIYQWVGSIFQMINSVREEKEINVNKIARKIAIVTMAMVISWSWLFYLLH